MMATTDPASTAAPLRIALLGGCEVRRADGTIVSLDGKAALLLAVLALKPGHSHSRDTLTGLLWSDRADMQARASLRQTLWALRKALRGIAPDPLRTSGDSVLLDESAVSVDVRRFESLVSIGTSDALLEATASYRGELLQGFRIRDRGFEAFVVPERERLHAVAQTALKRLLISPALDDRPEQAIEVANRLITLDPFDEAAHRGLMAHWAQQGCRDLALGQYRACVGLLERELGTVPEQETERLAADIRAGRIPQAPPSKPTIRAPPMPSRSVLQATAGLTVVLVMFITVAVGYFLPANSLDDGGAPRLAPALTIIPVSDRNEGDAGTALVGNHIMAELSRSTHISVIDASGEGAETGKSPLYLLGWTVGEGGGEISLSITSDREGAARPLWSESYNRRSNQPGEDLANRVVIDIAGVLLGHAAAELETGSAQAAAAFVRGWHHYRRHEPGKDREALTAFNEALALDPDFGRAHAGLAALYWRCWLHRCGVGRDLGLPSWGAAWDRTEHHMELAMERPTSLARRVAGDMLLRQGRHGEALAEAEQAVALDPSDADAAVTLADIRTIMGAPLEALIELQRIQGTDLDRSPLHPRAIGRALFATGRFAEAVGPLERAVALMPGDKAARELLTATYGHLGRPDSAVASAAVLTELVRRNLGAPRMIYRVHMAQFDYAAQLPGDRSLLLDGLRLAGIPE